MTQPESPNHPIESEDRSESKISRRRVLQIGSLAVVAAALGLAGERALSGDSVHGAGLVYVIPEGTYQSIAAGYDDAVSMPGEIVFNPGERARITVTNNDIVAELAGPFLVGPGQTFVQNFPSPGRYPISCTINPDHSVVVIVNG